jgi:hypothetical protein
MNVNSFEAKVKPKLRKFCGLAAVEYGWVGSGDSINE